MVCNKVFHSGKTPSYFSHNISVGNKYDLLREYVKGKSVLDIGCTGGDPQAYSSELWIHAFIKRHSNSILGLDLNRTEVDRLNGMGYDIVYGNAEHFNLNRKFDIIFSGDLIEHLYNTGDFLECVRSHMGPESRLILVTPNPYRYGRIEDIVLRGYVRNHVDHTCWFDPVTLTQLLNFYNFEVEDIYWTGYTKRMTHYLGFGFLNRLSFKGILALDFMIIAKLESK